MLMRVLAQQKKAILLDKKDWRILQEVVQNVRQPISQIAKQCQLLGIRNNIFLDDHENLYPVPPTQLYWRYNVNDGRTLPNIFATGVELLKMKRLPANTVEILAIYREDPDVIKFSHYIDALGSRFRDWYIPMLFMPRTLNDEPVVLQLECYIPIEYRSPCWGTASYGSD